MMNLLRNVWRPRTCHGDAFDKLSMTNHHSQNYIVTLSLSKGEPSGAVRRLLVWIIEVYQRTVSPDHGPLRYLHPYGFCRHHPTCSDYGKQVIEARGVVIGSLLLLFRLLSCHPWKQPDPERILAVLEKH